MADFINSANQNLHQTPHHKLVRRQTTESDESTFTPEDEAFCQAQLNAILCSTRTRQGLIDAELRCSRDRGIEQATHWKWDWELRMRQATNYFLIWKYGIPSIIYS
jgi:hypothetical protein